MTPRSPFSSSGVSCRGITETAAALWQYRAMQAEERLAQLEAGPIAGETSETTPGAEGPAWRPAAAACDERLRPQGAIAHGQ
jgi:hypothetical protein